MLPLYQHINDFCTMVNFPVTPFLRSSSVSLGVSQSNFIAPSPLSLRRQFLLTLYCSRTLSLGLQKSFTFVIFAAHSQFSRTSSYMYQRRAMSSPLYVWTAWCRQLAITRSRSVRCRGVHLIVANLARDSFTSKSGKSRHAVLRPVSVLVL